MKHTKVKDLLNSTTTLQEVNAKGWVRTFRNNQFIALNDGSTINNIQCVVDFENTPDETLKRITTGAAISVIGTLIESKGAGQKYEIQVNKLEILGDSDAEKFPIQPKNKPSLDFLREMHIYACVLICLVQLCVCARYYRLRFTIIFNKKVLCM